MGNREQKNVDHDEENPVNWGKEELDSWLQLHWPQLGKDITACQRLGYNSRNLSIRDISCDTQDYLYGRVKAAIFSDWSRAKGKGKREAWP